MMPWQSQEDDDSEKTEIWRSEEDQDGFEQTNQWIPDESNSAPSLLLAWLVVVYPIEKRGMMIELGPNTIIGRGREADIRWEDERLSRRHARFWLGLDQQANKPAYFITPLEARKAVEVNQVAITSSLRLYENDQVLLGDTLFVVKILE
jgi:hypothetical protein